jgi:hypothetical protein
MKGTGSGLEPVGFNQPTQRIQRAQPVIFPPKNRLQFNGFNHTLHVFDERVIR